jgi:hypothetical protein
MSETRYVVIPPSIECVLKHPHTGLPVAFEREFSELIEERTADTRVFGASFDGLLAAIAIRQAFAGSQPGQVVGLTLAQWQMLCDSIRAPHGGYNVSVMIQTVAHAQAILDAPSTRPASQLVTVAAE